MVANKSGVIMTVTAAHSRIGIPFVGGYGPAQAAKEAHRVYPLNSPSRYSRVGLHRRPCRRPRRSRRGLRASRQGIGNDLGAVARDARKQDAPATAYDTRGDG
jgi:hypothetical protein